MSRINVVRECHIVRSGRVAQIEGMFDLDSEAKSRQEWNVEIDLPDEWNVGLIVGPSGAGKSTIAGELFGADIHLGFDWPNDRSLIDAFPDGTPIKEITEALSSVGFSSPPAWLRPFRVLSTGQQFRAEMARLLVERADGLAVVDEFTSVVDRKVARIGSAAIAKAVRRRKQKFVAVTCHYDVIDWLDPDWVMEPATGKFYRRHLRGRPEIELEIRRCDREIWSVFRQHHYLSGNLHKSARCFVGLVDGEPAAFSAVLHFPHPRDSRIKREHRTVCLPDYQGVGIGNAMSSAVGRIVRGIGMRYLSTTSHPAMIRYRAHSPEWRMNTAPTWRGQSFAKGDKAKNGVKGGNKSQATRLRASFEYVGAPVDAPTAERLWEGR